MTELPSPPDHRASRRQARILVLLNGASEAGLVPIDILVLHAFAYLLNVMAPVWDMRVLDGKILKRKGGPFYPALQEDLDRLVGLGMVNISNVTHVQDGDGRWRLEGKYSLNDALSKKAVRFLTQLEEEHKVVSFARELAFALSALDEMELRYALTEDATYSDPDFSDGNVVDFAEWQTDNPSVNAANYFQALVDYDVRVSPGEKLHLYVRHLKKRAHVS